MIARIWRGMTRASDKDAYFEYLQKPVLRTTLPYPAIGASGCCGGLSRIQPSSR
jgi:hypothetical protein